MKQRLIVMNGYRILECECNGRWRTDKVDKANGLRAYIYSLYLAIPADQTCSYDGVVLYANKEFVYQHVKNEFVRHDRKTFKALPASGMRVTISYHKTQAIVSKPPDKPRRPSSGNRG
jgi:hypothetical protein